MKFSVSLALFLLGCQTLPEAARAPAQAAPDDVAELQNILAARTGRLDRDLVTFHYENASTSNFKPNTPADLQKRITGYPENFFNSQLRAWNDGPGEYTAIDPLASRSFGGDRPQLYVLTSPKGAVFLDTVSLTSPDEAAALGRLYAKNGCHYTLEPGSRVFTTWFAAFRNSDVVSCRELAIAAVRNLGIQMIVHDEMGAGNLQECRHARRYTFNLINSSAIKMDQIAYFDDQTAIDNKKIGSYVAALAAEAFNDPVIQELLPIAPPATLVGDASGGSTDWKKQFIFACGEKWNGELAAPPVSVSERLYQTYQNQQVLETAADTLRAYRRKLPDGEWHLSYLRQVVEMEYRAENPDGRIGFDDWWQALQNLLFKSDQSVVQAAQLLIENTPKISRYNLEEAMRGYWADHPEASPQETFAALGFSKQSTRFLLNEFWLNMGAAPALEGKLEPSVPLYLDILRRCKSTYLNPKATPEAIKAGPCGFL